MIKRWLKHPLVRGVDIDSFLAIERRRQIIEEKEFLKNIYREWYDAIADAISEHKGPVLELGSGTGFLRDVIPGVIRSDLLWFCELSIVLDGHTLPFGNGTLDAIVMTNVLHHLSRLRHFFNETARCIRPNGRIVMVEPWLTHWSRIVYSLLHSEPCNPNAAQWEFPSSGPLSGANVALPWIVFKRDRQAFEHEFPEWRVMFVRPMMPFCYLLSGGVSKRNLMPAWSYSVWRVLERCLAKWYNSLAMFALIVLLRTEHYEAS